MRVVSARAAASLALALSRAVLGSLYVRHLLEWSSTLYNV